MAPFYFLVPDEKTDYSATVQLGNVLYHVTEPDVVLFSPASADPPLELDGQPGQKTLDSYNFSNEAQKSHKYGLFAKILDFFGFGINASHAGATEDSESYETETMALSYFNPSSKFLLSLSEQPVVSDVIQNNADRCVFLITGVAVATGVKFESLGSRETENEGTLGVSAGGIAIGPSGRRSKKMVLKRSWKDKGPTVLGYAVQKLELGNGEDGGVSAEKYTAGTYFAHDRFDKGDRSNVVKFNAEVTAPDIDGMGALAVANEVTGEDCVLYLPD